MSHGSAKALVIEGSQSGSPRLVKKDVTLRPLGPHDVLLKVSAVAQNPTDVQALDLNIFPDGTILGCDVVGSVEAVGSSVTRVKEGDEIASLLWGGEVKGLGGYSDYTIVDERISFKVPKGISKAEAATVPLASLTSLLALFSKDSLGIEKNSNSTVLIWGGSSSVGLYAIQIAKLYGIEVVATCSPHSFDLVKSTGAKHVFDYRDPNVVESIKSVAPGLRYAFDTIGNSTSSVLASQALDVGGGTLCTVRPGKVFTENVTKQTKVKDVLVWTVFLKDHHYKQFTYPTSQEDHKLGADFCEELPALINEGKIKPSKAKVIPGGLDGVETGFQEHRDGKISGYKIVYEL